MGKYVFFTLLIALFFSCNDEEINPNLETGTFTDDRDGLKYNWVKIGNQTWMAENLKYFPSLSSMYRIYNYDGDSHTEAKSLGMYKTHGVLYSFKAVEDSVCPKGWHVPSEIEWDELASYISDEKGYHGPYYWNWPHVGKHLKAVKGWDEKGGQDELGFKALPGGLYTSSDYCWGFGTSGFWWTSWETEIGLKSSSDTLKVYGSGMGDYLSIRCIKK